MFSTVKKYSLRCIYVTLPFIASAANGQTMNTSRAESQQLMNAALPFAEQMLERHGEFFPYGLALNTEGKIVSVAGHSEQQQPQPSEIIQIIKSGFIEGAKSGQYKATALVYDARVTLPSTGNKSDAIAISLNHKYDYSVIVHLPYKIEAGKVIFGELFAMRGENDIFKK